VVFPVVPRFDDKRIETVVEKLRSVLEGHVSVHYSQRAVTDKRSILILSATAGSINSM